MTLTYSELKQAIKDYTQYDETTFVNNLPLFIRIAEERILKTVQLNLFQRNQQGVLTAGNRYLAVPTDYLATKSLSVIDGSGNAEFLLLKDLDLVQTYTPNPTTTGFPRYYAQFDVSNFILGPTPDAGYVVNLHYLYRPASITAGAESGTTWLSENAELALLYGSLIEAYTFMKGEADVMQQYTLRYRESLEALKQMGEAKEPTDEYRMGKVVRTKQ